MRHILLAAALIGLAVPSYAQDKSDIVVGTITDLSGPAAVYGHAVVNAMRLRFDAVNAAGGIRGRKLKLVVEDHQFQVPRAVQATSKLLKLDHAQVFVGSLGTAQVQAVLPQLRAAGVANLFPMAASRDLVHAPDAISWISGSLYYDQIRAGVKWMVETKAKQAILIDVETGKVVSAKNPRLWRGLLTLSATMAAEAALIVTADGTAVRSDDEDADGVLSKVVGRAVRLTDVAPAEPNNSASPERSLKISQLSEVALASAEKPTIGSNTRKLSMSCTSATKVASGARCGITT